MPLSRTFWSSRFAVLAGELKSWKLKKMMTRHRVELVTGTPYVSVCRVWLCAMDQSIEFYYMGQSTEFSYTLWASPQSLVIRYGPVYRIIDHKTESHILPLKS